MLIHTQRHVVENPATKNWTRNSSWWFWGIISW